jgi:hypothetical protein
VPQLVFEIAFLLQVNRPLAHVLLVDREFLNQPPGDGERRGSCGEVNEKVAHPWRRGDLSQSCESYGRRCNLPAV